MPFLPILSPLVFFIYLSSFLLMSLNVLFDILNSKLHFLYLCFLYLLYSLLFSHIVIILILHLAYKSIIVPNSLWDLAVFQNIKL